MPSRSLIRTRPSAAWVCTGSATACSARSPAPTDDDTDLTSRRVLDASRGTVLALRTRRYPDPVSAVRGLRSAGFQVVATSPRGRRMQALAELDGRPVALVVGGESDGVTAEVADAADLLVAIPMVGLDDTGRATLRELLGRVRDNAIGLSGAAPEAR